MAKEAPKSKTKAKPKSTKTTTTKAAAGGKKTAGKTPVKAKAAPKAKSKAPAKPAGKTKDAKKTAKTVVKAKAPVKGSVKIVPKSSSKAVAGAQKPVSLGKVKEHSEPASTKSAAAVKSSKTLSLKEAMRSSNTLQMFKNPMLEKLSHVHPLTPIFIYLPVIFLSIYYYFFSENSGLFTFLVFYLSGALFWTITEYTLHRFLFHPPYSETHMKWFYFYVHGVHHEVPSDATRLVMPPGASIPLAIIFFFIFRALMPDDYLAFYAGFVSGYLVYDFLHFATHFFSFEWEWFKKLRKHHNVHHFNAPNKNFGVSNSLWDYVFSTKYK